MKTKTTRRTPEPEPEPIQQSYITTTLRPVNLADPSSRIVLRGLVEMVLLPARQQHHPAMGGRDIARPLDLAPDLWRQAQGNPDTETTKAAIAAITANVANPPMMIEPDLWRRAHGDAADLATAEALHEVNRIEPGIVYEYAPFRAMLTLRTQDAETSARPEDRHAADAWLTVALGRAEHRAPAGRARARRARPGRDVYKISGGVQQLFILLYRDVVLLHRLHEAVRHGSANPATTMQRIVLKAPEAALLPASWMAAIREQKPVEAATFILCDCVSTVTGQQRSAARRQITQEVRAWYPMYTEQADRISKRRLELLLKP